MNNYNFTQSLDGLNNIEADNINSSTVNFSSANITTLNNCNLVNCNTSTVPLSNNSIVNKTYVDSNFVNVTTSQNIGGLKIFTNVYTFFKGVITFYDIVTPFTSYSQMYHTNAQFIFRNDSFSGIISFLIRPATGTPANIVNLSATEIRLNRAVKIYDTNSPQTGNTEILQAGTILSFTPSYNLGQYQFKTRTSTGASNTPLKIDNDGISVFGTTSCAVIESSAYRGTSATADLAIGGTTTSGTILIGTVINGTIGGEIRIGTTLSTNNINGNTTFQKLPLCSEVVSSASQLVNKTFTDLTYQTIAGMSAYLTTAIASNTYIDFTTDQTITGTKTFNTLAWTNSGNVFASSITGTYLNFSSLFNLNNYAFYTRDALSQSSISFQISSSATTINNSLVSNAQATFNNNCPISNINASSNNHLTTLGFNDNRYVDKVNNQAISGDKTFNGATTLNGTLSANAEVYCNTWLNLKSRTRVYDLTSGVNSTQMYMNNGNSFSIYPQAVSSLIAFFCRDAGNNEVNTFVSSSTANTSKVPFIANALATFNNGAVFNTVLPTTIINPSIGTHLTNKNYVDSNFMYKTDYINENITGEKTFQSSSFFSGSSGYFMINASMGNGYNPASTTGTIGIVGFKDQVNDNFLLTLYGTTHASVKLNFSSGVSIGFGGGVNPNTQVLCNGTNVVIKPALQYSGDSTIQNSAFTGAGSLNGSYNLANMTIDTNGKITSLSSGLSSTNTFTGTNSFVGDLIAKSNFKLYDTSNPSIYTNLFMYLNNFAFATVGGTNTTMTFSLNNNSGLAYEAMKLTNNLITFATSNIFLSNTGDTIIDSASTTGVSLFDTISSGTVSMFSSLSNSIVSMFNSSTNDATLEINANVKFRQVKLYNQVKTITGNITLDFPLEETIVIRPTAVMFIELPLITANSLGMSFNFITNSTAYAIWFESQGTDNIIKNGYTTGNTSTVVLGSIGITSVQMTCLELSTGVYTWSFFSSLPEKVTNPPGTIITMSVQSTPNGYLTCNGGSYTGSGIYANLYAVIGTTYGTNGVGTFKVPNFNNGSFLRGVTGNAGAIGTQQQDNIKTHTHNTTFYRFNNGSGGGSTDVISDLATGSVGSTVVSSAVNTAGSPDETRPINYAVYYCIKY